MSFSEVCQMCSFPVDLIDSDCCLLLFRGTESMSFTFPAFRDGSIAVDDVAADLSPQDSLSGMIPIKVIGDGLSLSLRQRTCLEEGGPS